MGSVTGNEVRIMLPMEALERFCRRYAKVCQRLA